MILRSQRRFHVAQTVIITSLFWIVVLLFANVYLTDYCARQSKYTKLALYLSLLMRGRIYRFVCRRHFNAVNKIGTFHQ